MYVTADLVSLVLGLGTLLLGAVSAFFIWAWRKANGHIGAARQSAAGRN